MSISHQYFPPVTKAVTRAGPIPRTVTKTVTQSDPAVADLAKRLAALEATVAELKVSRKRDDPAGYMREYRKRRKEK